jgi:endo-1,4-beta-xylanase
MRYPNRRRRRASVLVAGSFPVVLSLAAAARGQTTTVNGSSLVLRSSGAVSGSTGWTLSTDGYLGTYVQLSQPGPISFTAAASGASSGGVAPEMTFAIADYKQSFNLTSTQSNYTFTTSTLPAGTYFIRTQLDNQTATAQPTMTLASLKVAGTGTSVLNTSTDSNALASANTYIDNFRKGPATVSFTTPGGAAFPANTSVQVKLTRNAFNFGTNVWGNNQSDINSLLASNPAPGSLADNYQQFISQHFNAVVASNVGKWGDDEPSQGTLTMGASDTVLSFAKAHNMNAREHNLIWGNQQPGWVNTLLTNAQSSDPTTAANAKASLTSAITNRIAYYVGGTVTGGTDKRAADFIEMDGLNESLHTAPYWKIYGASGIADIYHQSVQAIAATPGSHAGVYLNEYNVFQNSPQSINTNVPAGSPPTQSGSDNYANWYRQNVEDLNNAGFGKVVTGIGVQYYPTASGAAPSAARINQVMQNLGVEGLPITLTEFGVQSTEPTTAAPQIMEDAMRMMLGSPDATGFFNWGWWAGATSNLGSSGVMVNTTWKNPDGSWNLTPTGTRYEWLFGMNTDSVTGGHNSVNTDPWTTNLTLTTNANGQINFNGFYGDYSLTVNGHSYNVSLTKGGTSNFTIQAIPGGPVWILSTGGSFATPSNWADNVIPGGIGAEADFLDAIQADSTVTLNGGTTLGMIVFNNPHTYTLAGSSASITMKTSSGPATINLQGGATQQISVPLIIASNTTLNTAAGTTLRLSGAVTVNGGATVTPSGGGAVSYESSVTVQGGGAITFASASHGTALTLADGGATAAVSPHAGSSPTVMQFDSLSIGTSSTLDLANNELLTGTALSVIRTQIATDKLITSSAGGALGSLDNGSGTVEVLFTLLGDTDLNGNVNVADLANLAANFGVNTGGVWTAGDFDYNGNVNVADLADLAANFGDTLPLAGGAAPDTATVPEPEMIGLLGGILALLWSPRPRTCGRGLG